MTRTPRSIASLGAALAAAGWLGPFVAAAAAAEPASCRTVRFSDVGWTDITATTAVVSTILKGIGYAPKTTILSVPVTFQSLKNKDLDVFLGNWMPAQTALRAPLVEDKSIDVVGVNLTGAKYTLAVPTYAYDAGLRSFADIHGFAGPLKGKIYGIEAGNEGNQHVLDLIKADAFDLGTFKLVASSEQGMLAEVGRAVRQKQPVVFLAWEPHPMNTEFDIKYLSGGDDSFGPDYGGATVYTLTRGGYAEQCPNVYKLLRNLTFNLGLENGWMGSILVKHVDPDKMAAAWIKANPEMVKAWLEGVTTFEGAPAAAALMGASQ